MKQLSLFFLMVCYFFTSTSAQEIALEFHSSFEKESFKKHLDNEADMLSLQLISDKDVEFEQYQSYKNELDRYVNRLKEKGNRSQSEIFFLSSVFYKTHKKFLKRYKKFTSLSDMFETGKYDCLSATTLYTLIYNSLGVDLEVIETNHHIYLKLTSQGQTFLVESTDPLHGFISDKKEIAEKLSDVYTGQRQVASSKDGLYHQFSFLLNERIDMTKLVGLQYYNQAVKVFNEGQAATAIKLLEKGSVFYNNKRFKEFGILLANKIYEDQQMDRNIKSRYIDRVSKIAKVDFIIASR